MDVEKDENTIVDNVIGFWFADASNSPENAFSRKTFWYNGGKIIDQKIQKTFLGEVRSACDGELSHWVNTARGALALIIILDQFTRNIFRNTPQAYSGDELALDIVNTSIKRGHDIVLPPASTIWLYHPFHHSEKVEEQDHGLALLNSLKERSPEAWHDYIEKSIEGWTRHRQIISRFGRFPHRNRILKRESTSEEKLFLKKNGRSFGQGPRLINDD